MVTPITSQIYFAESSGLRHNAIRYTVGSSEFESTSKDEHQWFGCDQFLLAPSHVPLFGMRMTKGNRLTSSDRKISIDIFPESHECDVGVHKKLYVNSVSSAVLFQPIFQPSQAASPLSYATERATVTPAELQRQCCVVRRHEHV